MKRLLFIVIVISVTSINPATLDYNELNEKLKINKETVISGYDRFSLLTDSLRNLIKTENEDVEKMKRLAAKYETSDSNLVKFNVGGTYFSTLKATIEKRIKRRDTNAVYKPNLLQSLLNDETKSVYDENKAIFINRNPKYFSYIIDFLRSPNSSKNFMSNVENVEELVEEAEFYELNSLIDSLNGIALEIVATESVSTSTAVSSTSTIMESTLSGSEEN